MGIHRFLACLTLVILAVTGCYPQISTGPEEETLRLVEVVELHNRPVAESFTLIGTTEPWQETILYFEVTGVVAEVFVEEGDLVEPGDPIARLVLDDYQLALSQAGAQLKTAQAGLKLLLAGTRKEDLDAARADFAQAKARVAYWISELSRNRKLLAKNAISDSIFEQVQREHDATVQKGLLAKARLERAVAGPRKEDIEAAAAEVEARTQAAALARRQLEKATLRAPFGGRVERRLLDVGAYVNIFPTGGVPVVHLVDLDKVDALIAVPEGFLSRFAQRPQVKIVSAVDPQVRAQGESIQIISLGRVADRASGTYQLRVRIANPDGRFTGSMVVIAETTSRASHQAVRIPVTAVCRAYGQPPYVLLVEPDDSRVVAREVKLGPIAGDRVEISAGLSEGELLIIRGQDRVVVGDRVKYQPAVPASAGPIQRSLP